MSVECPKCGKAITDEPVATSFGFIPVYSCKNCDYYGELLFSSKQKLFYTLITVADVILLFLFLSMSLNVEENGALYRNGRILLLLGLAGPAMLLKDYFTRKRIEKLKK